MEGPEPTLRVAKGQDAAAIQKLMKASAAGLFPSVYSERQVRSGIKHVAEVDPQLLEDGTYYVLEAGGEMVACGGWSKRARPYTGSGASASDNRLLDPSTEAAHIRAMFTRPDWTRRGLGRRIIAECERAAAAAGYQRMDLLATLSGVPLYEACGFVASGAQYDIALTDGVPMACLPMSKPIGTRLAATA
jgi:GNAT superfamily N-acetyltransferase